MLSKLKDLNLRPFIVSDPIDIKQLVLKQKKQYE